MGFKIMLAGQDDPIFETDDSHEVVDRVSIQTARGEVYSYGSPIDDDWVRIEVIKRGIGPDTYLDAVTADRVRQYQEKYEQPPADMDAYVAADPETGQPVENQGPQGTEETATPSAEPASAVSEF